MASVEIVFVNVNPQATLLLGQARGCAVTALVSCDLPVAEYTALQMKQSVTGHGRAAKSQIQEMVKRLLQLPVLPRQDAATIRPILKPEPSSDPRQMPTPDYLLSGRVIDHYTNHP